MSDQTPSPYGPDGSFQTPPAPTGFAESPAATSQPWGAHAATVVPGGDVLAHGEDPAPRWGRRVAVGATALAVVAAAGVGVFAYEALSGGGTQPEKLVPADAVFYAELDLDPPAGQKVNTARFLKHFPSAAEALGGGDDIASAFAKAVFSDGTVDYQTQVEPWLGDRVAVAVVPGEDLKSGPQVVAVLQVKDQAKAEQALPDLISDDFAQGLGDPTEGFSGLTDDTTAGGHADGGKGGYAFGHGYVVLAESDSAAKAAIAAADNASLADDADYRADMDRLGDRVATLWLDGKGIGELLKQTNPDAMLKLSKASYGTGRSAVALRMEPNVAEIVGFTTDPSMLPSEVVSQVATLPDDTSVALEVGGLGKLLHTTYDNYIAALKEAGFDRVEAKVAREVKQYGVTLPGDLDALGGTDFLVAMGSSPEEIAVRVSSDPQAAQRVADIWAGLPFTGGLPAPEVEGSSVTFTTSPGWTKGIGSGSLGEQDSFTQVLPQVDNAVSVVYVDLEHVLGLIPQDGEDTADMKPLKGLGVSASSDGTFHLRLSVR